jgi:hypothetical protein
MMTLTPHAYIVYVRQGFAGRYWATTDGKSAFSAASVSEFAEELRRRSAKGLYALPARGTPPGVRDMSAEDASELLSRWHG